MKKFVTAIIISFVVTVSSAGIKAAAFSSSNLGAAFVLSNVMSDEKNDFRKQPERLFAYLCAYTADFHIKNRIYANQSQENDFPFG